MSRFTGSEYKRSRAVGISTTETGRELAKRPNRPGQHGADRRGKLSDYGRQLKEKQKVRFMYGLSERQLRKTFDEAGKMKGIHGTNFLRLLESRLDNIAFRIGFAATRRGARQLVNHGHVTVNGKKVDIPSYRCKPGDVISLKEKDMNLKVVNESLEKVSKRVEFINYDENKKAATYVRYPERNELNADIDEAAIVEFYNK
ncbi:MAG: 30S ribosomal protein S4 [Bacilli bacterium]|nr:30S ribosomal protein S4 [Bacilli bacterium]